MKKIKLFHKIKQLGFTLIEVIVTIGISSIVMLGAIAIYVNTVKDNVSILDQIKLNYSLQNSLNLMVSHIRRAGYWSDAQSQIFNPAISNPFMSASSVASENTVITVYNSGSVSSTGNCILFAYNLSASSTLPSIGSTPDDRFGFRLNNGVIQYRVPSADFTCTGSSASWEDITDPNKVFVDSLSFTEDDNQINIGSGNYYTVKSIDIQISAHLTNNSSISLTISQKANTETGIFTD